MVNSRQKGKNFELKIADKLTSITGHKWKPTPGSGAYATRTGDLKLAGDIFCPKQPSEFVWECKKYKEVDLADIFTKNKNLRKWIAQLEREKKHKKGALVFARNYGKIITFIETDLELKNTMKYDKYTVGLFDEVIPKVLK